HEFRNVGTVLVQAGNKNDREAEIHRLAGGSNEEALPLWVGTKLVRLAGERFRRRVPRHFYVATQRKRADPVIGIAFAESKKARSKSDRKRFDLNFEVFGYEKVA